MTAAVTAVNEAGSSPYVLLCEHASNVIPGAYGGLGLPPSELVRHIAWDIGAAELATALSAHLDAPLFLAGYSRLLIDCNRPPGAPTSIPLVSEATRVPGNQGVDDAERARRADSFFWPFQRRVSAHLDARRDAGRPAVVVGIHSFTPVFHGQRRPWHGGVLFRRATAFAEALLAELREPGLHIGANEPYSISDETDYTVPAHGEQRGLRAVLIETRQDLISDDAGVAAWSDRIGRALARVAREL